MSEKLKPAQFENLKLREGSHAYLLSDERISVFKNDNKSMTMEEAKAQMEQEAQFIGKVRQQVEAQGGKFNGIETIDVNIPDPEWMGSSFPHRLVFVLVDLS